MTKPTKWSAKTDQPGHLPSLIRVFAVCSMVSWGPNVSSCGQRRLWSVWVDAQADPSLHWVQRSFCLFCHEVAQMSSVMILRAWANSADPNQTARGAARGAVWSGSTVCHSVCIVWTYYSMVEPHCSNFRIITAIFWVSEYLGILRYYADASKYCKPIYSKIKNLITWKNYSKYPKIWLIWIFHRVMCPKDADGIANSIDPEEQSDQRSSLIWVYTVCSDLSVQKLTRIIMVI